MKLKLQKASLKQVMGEIESWKLPKRPKAEYIGGATHTGRMTPQPNFQTLPLRGSTVVSAIIECLSGHVWHNGIKVQFPNALRQHRKKYICNLRAIEKNGSISYYSAIKGTIADGDTGRIVG